MAPGAGRIRGASADATVNAGEGKAIAAAGWFPSSPSLSASLKRFFRGFGISLVVPVSGTLPPASMGVGSAPMEGFRDIP